MLGAGVLVSAVLGCLTFFEIASGRLQAALIAGHLLTIAILSFGIVAMRREDRFRRHAEEDLRNSESRTRTILETAVDAIISIDEWGTVESLNPAAVRILGYERAEVIGKNVNLFMPSPDHEAHDGYLARYRATGERKIIGIGREVVCRRKDGTLFHADLAVGEHYVGGHRKFTGFLRDISDRKWADARIHEQAALLDKAREAILVRDVDDRITYWNHGAERIYGWSSVEACGRTCRELLFHGNDVQLESARRAVMSGDEWVGELRASSRSGQEVIIESRWSLLRDDLGRPRGILAIEADISEKKARERHALRAQRLESIGTLADGIAHDLNNMLTPILMSAKLLRKERPAAEREGLLANIQASAERGAEMVKHLLSFTGGLETERTRLDLPPLIDEIKSLLEHTLPKSIAIHIDVPEALYPVAGNATQLSQVLMNLCVNARDAMPEGGVLTITAENCLLDDDFRTISPEAAAGPHVRLTVSDTGEGIPPEIVDRVFDPFFTTKEYGKGTGLGLSSVRGIVKSHNGLVRVVCPTRQGARFEIYLPAFEATNLRQPGSSQPVTFAVQGQLILVVDDERNVRFAIKATLEDAGYRVLTAHGGDEALNLARQRSGEIDAAIVDTMMPGMSGPATMRALHEISPRLRLIASSGLRSADQAPTCARAFLAKPYTNEQLLATLAVALQTES